MNSIEVLAEKIEELIAFVQKTVLDSKNREYPHWHTSMWHAFRGITICQKSMAFASNIGLHHVANGASRVAFLYNFDGENVIVKIPRNLGNDTSYGRSSTGNEDEYANFIRMASVFHGIEDFLCPILHSFRIRESLILVVKKMRLVDQDEWYRNDVSNSLNSQRYNLIDLVSYDATLENCGIDENGLLYLIDYNIVPMMWSEYIIAKYYDKLHKIEALTREKLA